MTRLEDNVEHALALFVLALNFHKATKFRLDLRDLLEWLFLPIGNLMFTQYILNTM